MPNILDEIISTKRVEVEAAKAKCSLESIKAMAEEKEPPRDFCAALKSGPDVFPEIRIIAECKSKSPSRGVICENYDPVAIAQKYERGSAAAISVLTDQQYFGGSLEHLRSVSQMVNIPVMRKDFIIDEYQIYEARAYGADSFLILANVLDLAQLQYFIEIGRELGMEPLLETYSYKELEEALKTDAKIVGINNRDLKSFTVDLDGALQLLKTAKLSDKSRVLVCESGIKGRKEVELMASVGYKTFLIGEALMRSGDPEAFLKILQSGD